MHGPGITVESRRVIADFAATATADQRARLDEVIGSLSDGSWDRRWWQCLQHPSDADLWELHPGESLLVLFNKVYDDDRGCLVPNIVCVDCDQRYDEPTCGI